MYDDMPPGDHPARPWCTTKSGAVLPQAAQAAAASVIADVWLPPSCATIYYYRNNVEHGVFGK